MNDTFWNNTYNNPLYGGDDLIAQPLLEYISLINQTDQILDYGGGSGRITKYIHKRLPDVNLHLYDVVEKAIQDSYSVIPDNHKILRSYTRFIPLFKYTKIIAHRVLHNMPDKNIDAFFQQLMPSLCYGSDFFISVKSKNCPKYITKLNDKNFIKEEGGFFSAKDNRYVKFYSLGELQALLTGYNIIIETHGEFIEQSFRRRNLNQYIYVHGKYKANNDQLPTTMS